MITKMSFLRWISTWFHGPWPFAFCFNLQISGPCCDQDWRMHPGGLRSHEQCEDMKCLTMSYVQCYHEAMGYPTSSPRRYAPLQTWSPKRSRAAWSDVGLAKCRVCPWQFNVEHDFKNAAKFHPSLYKISEPICSHTHSQGQHYPSKVITMSQQQSLHADWWIVALQVCRIIISWIGGRNRTRSFWVPWRPVSVRSWGKVIGRNDVAILKWLEAVSHLSGLEGRDMFRHTFVLDVFW